MVMAALETRKQQKTPTRKNAISPKTQKFNKPFQTMKTILLFEAANLNKVFEMLLSFQLKRQNRNDLEKVTL